MSEVASSLAPVRRTVTVPLGQSRAFELFTARFGEWWPLATHSVWLEDAALVRFPCDGAGATLVTLTHSGWERRADDARARLGYDSGWEPVLAAFGAAAAA